MAVVVSVMVVSVGVGVDVAGFADAGAGSKKTPLTMAFEPAVRVTRSWTWPVTLQVR